MNASLVCRVRAGCVPDFTHCLGWHLSLHDLTMITIFLRVRTAQSCLLRVKWSKFAGRRAHSVVQSAEAYMRNVISMMRFYDAFAGVIFRYPFALLPLMVQVYNCADEDQKKGGR
jgi:hypothetical protein